MKYTLFLTHRCNLACDYCYVSKSSDCMSLSVAQRVIDFAFQNTPPADDIEIGFFGGEPLLEFPLLRDVTRIVRSHPSFDPCRVNLSLTTNGTLLTPEIVEFLGEHEVLTTISCDGRPPGARQPVRARHGMVVARPPPGIACRRAARWSAPWKTAAACSMAKPYQVKQVRRALVQCKLA